MQLRDLFSHYAGSQGGFNVLDQMPPILVSWNKEMLHKSNQKRHCQMQFSSLKCPKNEFTWELRALSQTPELY